MGVAPQGRATRKAPVRAEPHPTRSFALPAPGLFNRARARSRSLIVAGQKTGALVNEHDCGGSPYLPGS
jgi:hypothetical protein